MDTTSDSVWFGGNEPARPRRSRPAVPAGNVEVFGSRHRIPGGPAYESCLPPVFLPPYSGRRHARRGNLLLYSSDRTGKPQAFRMDLKTGESDQLTDAAALVGETLCLLPDGRSLCYFDGPWLRPTVLPTCARAGCTPPRRLEPARGLSIWETVGARPSWSGGERRIAVAVAGHAERASLPWSRPRPHRRPADQAPSRYPLPQGGARSVADQLRRRDNRRTEAGAGRCRAGPLVARGAHRSLPELPGGAALSELHTRARAGGERRSARLADQPVRRPSAPTATPRFSWARARTRPPRTCCCSRAPPGGNSHCASTARRMRPPWRPCSPPTASRCSFTRRCTARPRFTACGLTGWWRRRRLRADGMMTAGC